MILHYLKIAFRNLWKYKSQSIISILGVAMVTIISKVWKTANENPSEVIKSE